MEKEACKITTMQEAITHGKWLDKEAQGIKDATKLLKEWLRPYFNLPSPPEHCLKTKECLTLAELAGCKGDSSELPMRREFHVDKCPYCIAMLKAYEEEKNALDVEKRLEEWLKDSETYSSSKNFSCLKLEELKSYARGELDEARKKGADSCLICKRLMAAVDQIIKCH